MLTSAAGRELDYKKLWVTDSDDIPLAARFELRGKDAVRIVVDDTDATYPVAVDPLLTSPEDTRIESNEAGAGLGISVAGAGDVNGDGFADIIAGAELFDTGLDASDEGAAFIFHGSALGVVATTVGAAATVLASDETQSRFGRAVSGAGDVNGDGYADVVVGAWKYDTGLDSGDEGAAFLFLGSALGISTVSVAPSRPPEPSAQDPYCLRP